LPYCPKCGSKVDETMAFCPQCGAPLKAAVPSSSVKRETYEKAEKHEKQEPEKAEKHEKGEAGFVGWLIAGFVLIFIGLISFINTMTHFLSGPVISALSILLIGVLIIAAGVYLSARARKRYPPPA